jgi:microcystin-dependent protein
MFAGNFPPVGWMFCDGPSLPISENEYLFQLIGTTYGGDGQETFNLPNLRAACRSTWHGPGRHTYHIGEMAGRSRRR